MFWNLTRVEITKVYKRALIWILVTVVVGLALIANITQSVLLPVDLNSPEAQETLAQITWPGALLSVPRIGSAAGLGSILIIMLVGTVMGQEYSWRTLHLWLSQGLSRNRLLLAKFVVSSGAALLFIFAPLIVGGVHSLILTYQYYGGLEGIQVDWGMVGQNALLGAYTLLPYIALALLLAVISRSTVVPVAGGLVIVLIIETVLPQILGLLGEPWSIGGYMLPLTLASLLVENEGAAVQVSSGMVGQPFSPLVAGAGIAFWTVLFLGLALWVLRKQDLTG